MTVVYVVTLGDFPEFAFADKERAQAFVKARNADNVTIGEGLYRREYWKVYTFPILGLEKQP